MKKIKKNINFLFVALIFSASILTFTACSDDDDELAIIAEEEVIDDTDFEATDWTDATHSKSTDPNFDEVFEDNAV